MLDMPNFQSHVETVTAVHTLLGTPNYYRAGGGAANNVRHG